MAQITLKKATLKDIETVTALEKGASSKTYSARTTPAELKRFITKQAVFLIKNQQTTVGLLAYELIGKKRIHFNGLIIDPKFRRRGFARLALIATLNKLKKYPRTDLVAHPHNSAAIALYLSLGFIIEAWHDNHFGDGEARLELVKK